MVQPVATFSIVYTLDSPDQQDGGIDIRINAPPGTDMVTLTQRVCEALEGLNLLGP